VERKLKSFKIIWYIIYPSESSFRWWWTSWCWIKIIWYM